MTIQLDPSRIRLSPGGKPADRRRALPDAEPIVVPSRAHINYVPSPDSLMTLINSAVSALRRGIHWDRGTILNLLV